MSGYARVTHATIEDLPAGVEILTEEAAAGVLGGDTTLMHENTHQSSTSPPTWPPNKPQPIIAILIG